MKYDKLELEAHGKINLYLDVTGKRADGYHYIYSMMQNIGISDRVVIEQITGDSNNYCIVKGLSLIHI